MTEVVSDQQLKIAEGVELGNYPAAEAARMIVRAQTVDPAYFEVTLNQRSGVSSNGEVNSAAAGSIYPGMSSLELQAALLTAEWEAYEHETIAPCCLAFKASIPGLHGMIAIESLPDDAEISLSDPKGTGFVSASVSGVPAQEVDFTILIVGPVDEKRYPFGEPPPENHEELMMWTFHPGAPVTTSNVKSEGNAGRTLNKQEALALGLTMAKLVDPRKVHL